jgi:hypothetical protein
MFDTIAKIMGLHREQRAYPRKCGKFAVSWGNGQRQGRGTGSEISANGLIFACAEDIGTEEVTVAFMVAQKERKARLRIVRRDSGQTASGTLHQYAGNFVGIAADDWDALMRFVHDEPEPENKAAAELEERGKQDDDAYRSLPLRIQQRLISMLVAANRLDQPLEGQAPTIRVNVIGKAKSKEGASVLRVNIHSRRRVDGESYAYDSQFQISEADGTVERLS